MREKLLRFLSNPRSYPHRPRRVHVVETNASFVFLARPFVFKVKKAVDFGFLDFSTLAKRRHFCEREVALNRRLCPRLYLGVVPIRRANGRLGFGENGEVLEYAVKMRQLSAAGFLKQRLRRDDVLRRDLRRVIMLLQRFYQQYPATKEIEAWGQVERLRISTDENFRQTRQFVGRTISLAAHAAIHCFTNEFYAARGPLFTARIRGHHIRDCHGDLHCEHVHITPDTLHIIDCIEFNDRFRYVDVANDVAFLAMDLDYAGRTDLADYFAKTMSKVLADEQLLHLMDFYKSYRAFVRGKVESLHSVSRTISPRERAACATRARRYFQLALRYAVAGSRPMVLAVMGRIGAGKSHFARTLHEELGWSVFSSDELRKRMAGVPVYRRSNESMRRQLYASAMTRKTYAALAAAAGRQVHAGRGVILDATFGRREQRDRLRKQLARHGVRLCFLEMQADDATIRRRLAARRGASREASDARLEDFTALTAGYEPPVELEAGQLLPVNSRLPMVERLTRVFKSLVRLNLERCTS